MSRITLTPKVYSQICHTLTSHLPESGGVLGGTADGIITDYYFDATGISRPDAYIPDVEAINRVLAEDWMVRGVLMRGIVHSHANGVDVPSCGDIAYGVQILAALDTVEEFYLPIVTVENGEFRMAGYVLRRNDEGRVLCRAVPVVICDDDPSVTADTINERGGVTK